MSKFANLYLPGLTEEGLPRTHINIPGWWDQTRSDQARGGPGEAYREDLARCLRENTPGGMCGLVLLERIDTATGKVVSIDISHNVETDNYFNNQALKIFGSGAYTPTQGQYLALSTATATALTSGSPTAGSVYSNSVGYPVVAGGNASFVAGIASSSFQATASVDGTKQNTANAATGVPTLTGGKYPGSDNTYGTGIIIGYGTANAEVTSGSTTASLAAQVYLSGSGSSQVNYTLINNHTSADYVVAGPSCKDGPTSAPAGAIISTALPGTPSAGLGVGNRSMQLQFTFTNPTYAAGNYTDLWVITVASTGGWTAATAVYAHTVNAPQTLNSSTSVQATYLAIY